MYMMCSKMWGWGASNNEKKKKNKKKRKKIRTTNAFMRKEVDRNQSCVVHP
jgi:hypothetical protein